MLSAEQNKLLTETTPDSRMGKLLRCYWYPIATVHELEQKNLKALRLLGENLVLFRAKNGEFGLTESRCPHRGASLDFAMAEKGAIRCAYHGWKFDSTGQCLETPNEPSCSNLARKVKIKSYRAAALGGLVFAYLGEQPAPALPAIDLLTMGGVVKRARFADIPCNWLQIMENALDPTHLEWLHGHFVNYISNQSGNGDKFKVNRHEKIAFEQTEYGIVKRRTIEGQSFEDDDWIIGQHLIFPNIFRVGKNSTYSLHFRIPVDNTRTIYLWYDCHIDQPAAGELIPREEIIYRDKNGQLLFDSIEAQDIAIFLSQGEIVDRSIERLGSVDQGILLFRKMLIQNLLLSEANKAPLNFNKQQQLNFKPSSSEFKVLEPLHV